MAFAEKLHDAPKRMSGTPCSVGVLENYLEGAEAEAFASMMYALGWSQERIYEAVRQESRDLRTAADKDTAAGRTKAAGVKLATAEVYSKMGRQTVNRHRSRGCRCFKDRP